MAMILPTVAPTAQPMQQFAAPAGKNMAAEQTMQAGEAMTKAGNAVHNVFADIQSNIDTATTKEIDNKLSDVIHNTLYDPEKGYLKTAGKSAIESRSAVIDQIKKASEELSQGLTNEVQQYMFKQTATARMRQAMGQIDTHAMKQTQVYNMGETEARLKGFMRDAEANVNDREAFNTAKTSMLREADDYIKLSGMGADQGKQYKLTATTTMHGNVISQLLNGDEAKLAQEYFTRYKDEINPDKYDEFSKVIGDKVAFVNGNDMGSGLFAKYAPKNKNESIKTATAKMLTDIDKSGADEHTKEYAKKVIHDKASQYTMGKTGAAEDVSDEVHGFMNGKGATYGSTINLINQRNKGDKIDNSAADSLRADARRHFKVEEAEADAKAQRRYEEMAKGLDYLQRVMQGLEGNPTQQEVLRKKGAEFGPATPVIAKGVEAIRSNLANPKLTEAQFNKKLSQMGEKVLGFNPDSKDEGIKRRKFSMFLETIDAMAQAGAKGPGQEQPTLDKLILGTVQKIQIDAPLTIGGFNIPFTGKEVRAYDINTLSDKEKRDFVIKRIREAGKVPTPNAIADGLNKLNRKSDRGIYNSRYTTNYDEGE